MIILIKDKDDKEKYLNITNEREKTSHFFPKKLEKFDNVLFLAIINYFGGGSSKAGSRGEGRGARSFLHWTWK